MKKIATIFFAIFCLALCSAHLSAQSQGNTAVNAGDKLLADKYGIRITESTGDASRQGNLNFLNTNNRITVLEWNVLNNGGKVSYAGCALTVVPNQSVSLPLNGALQKALAADGSSIQFTVKN